MTKKVHADDAEKIRSILAYNTTHINKTIAKMHNELVSLKEWIKTTAIDSGMNPTRITIHNAQLRITAVIKELDELQKEVIDIGYKSVPLALKALKQIKGLEITGLDLLPEVFHSVPRIWFDGKPDGKDPVKNPGCKPMSVSVAKRKLRVVQPLIVEAWELADGNEMIQSDIINEYLTTSADSYEKTLYTYIYDLEEIPLEEELTNLPVTEADLARSLKLATDPNRIYGVRASWPPEED